MGPVAPVRPAGSVSGRSRTCTAFAGGLQRLGSPVPGRHGTVARVGVEPTGTRLSTWPLCRFAYHAIGQYDVRESNPPGLLERQATSPEVERRIGQSARRESNPPVLLGGQVPGPLGHGHVVSSGRRGSRTLKARRSPGFKPGAVACRLALPCQSGWLDSNQRGPASEAGG